MGWIIAIIVGGVAGWLASIVMRRDASMGIFWNIIVGIVGALRGNAVLARLLGFGGSIQSFDLGAFVIAILGAVVLLGIVNLVQRGRVRYRPHSETVRPARPDKLIQKSTGADHAHGPPLFRFELRPPTAVFRRFAGAADGVARCRVAIARLCGTRATARAGCTAAINLIWPAPCAGPRL